MIERARTILAIAGVGAIALSGCSLGADSSAVRGAVVETSTSTTEPSSTRDSVAPTTAAPVTEAPTTTAPEEIVSSVSGGIPGKETSSVMNVNDNYVVGVAGAECDAAWNVMVRGVDLSSLTPEDPIGEYVTAFEQSLEATIALASVASPVLKSEAEGATLFFQALLASSAVSSVEQIRVATNEWATRDGVNAGTLLFAIEDACPMIVQNAVAPEAVF